MCICEIESLIQHFIFAVAEVSFNKDECGKLILDNLINGKNLLNATGPMDVAIKADCEPNELLDSKEKFCMVVEKSACDDAGIILDERAMLSQGSCDMSVCQTGLRMADDDTEEPIPAENAVEEEQSNKPEEEKKARTVNRQKQQKGSLTGMERSVNVSSPFV